MGDLAQQKSSSLPILLHLTILFPKHITLREKALNTKSENVSGFVSTLYHRI